MGKEMLLAVWEQRDFSQIKTLINENEKPLLAVTRKSLNIIKNQTDDWLPAWLTTFLVRDKDI